MVVYSKDNCPACNAVMSLLANNEVKFEEKNISEDEGYMQEVQNMGYNSVPITVTESDKVIIGFDLPLLQTEIKNNNN